MNIDYIGSNDHFWAINTPPPGRVWEISPEIYLKPSRPPKKSGVNVEFVRCFRFENVTLFAFVIFNLALVSNDYCKKKRCSEY